MTADPRSVDIRRPEIVDELLLKLAHPTDTPKYSELSRFYQITLAELNHFRKRHSEKIKNLKDQLIVDGWDGIADRYRILAFRAINRTEEMLDKASAKDASIIAQIATDKVLLLESKGIKQVSIVHEHRHSLAGVSKLLVDEIQRRKLLEAPAADSAEASQVIDVEPE